MSRGLQLVFLAILASAQAIPVKDVHRYCQQHQHVGSYRASTCHLTCTSQSFDYTNTTLDDITVPGVICAYDLKDYCMNGTCPDRSNTHRIVSNHLAYRDHQELVAHSFRYEGCFVPSDFKLQETPLANRSKCMFCGGYVNAGGTPGETWFESHHSCVFGWNDKFERGEHDNFLLEAYTYKKNGSETHFLASAQLYTGLTQIIGHAHVLEVEVSNQLKSMFDDDGEIVSTTDHALRIGYQGH